MTGRHGRRAGRPGTAGPQSVRRTAGWATGGTLALVLLVCGCVFAALAGPALSLHTRSQALHQTLAGLASPVKTVQVSGSWSEFTTTLQGAGALPGHSLLLPGSMVEESMGQLATGFRAAGLPLAAGSWFGLNSNPLPMSGPTPETNAGAPSRLEVTYRDALPGNAQLVAGSYTIAKVPAGMLPVTATIQTAALFGLHPGSRMVVASPGGPLKLLVTAIVRQRQPGSAFWTQDSTVGIPSLTTPPRGLPPPHNGMPYWVAGVFADPGQFTAMQVMFSGPGMDLTWEFPLSVGGIGADQVQALYDRLNQATAGAAPLTGSLTEGASIVAVTTPLLPSLAAFLATQAAIQTVLLLLFVSMIVTGAAVILLAARMIVLRRTAELSMLRARGGSLRQVAALMAREQQRGIAAGRMVLAGFSQGGAMSLYMGARYPERIAGIVALSCYLPLALQLAVERLAVNQSTPIFMAHGSLDAVIEERRGLESRAALEAAGYAVQWHSYRMAHAICTEELAAISAFLQRVLSN